METYELRTGQDLPAGRLKDAPENEEEGASHKHDYREGKQPGDEDIAYHVGLKVLHAFARDHASGNP